MLAFEPVRKIIWAADPFEEDNPLRRKTAQLFLKLIEQLHAQGELVYVFSPAELNLTPEYSLVSFEQYFPAAVQALEDYAKKLAPATPLTTHVVSSQSASTRSAVNALTHYAKQTHADLILVGTHQRSGASRFFLGSFAETLSLHTDIPVIVNGWSKAAMGQPVKEVAPIQRILFPTDFSPESRTVFEYAVSVASQIGAKITVFHCLQRPVEPIIQSGIYLLGGGWVPMHFDMGAVAERAQKELDAWCKEATKTGVTAEWRIDDREIDPADAVLGTVQEIGADLLVMAAESGAFSTFIAGSLTRQLTRRASCPIWILHAQGLTSRIRTPGERAPKAAA